MAMPVSPVRRTIPTICAGRAHWWAALRSPYPHARLVRIDSSRVKVMPGVWLVWHRDQPPVVDRIQGRVVFADELAYQGAEVAFVLADDKRIAADALAAIEVEYEELPFVYDLDSAMAEGAPPALLGQSGTRSTPRGQPTHEVTCKKG